MKAFTLSRLLTAFSLTALISDSKGDGHIPYTCPSISELAFDCNVKEIGKLDPTGNYGIFQATIVVSTTESAQCASTMRFQVLGSDRDFLLSCASGYKLACNKGCVEAFIQCKADREGGSQYLEGKWKLGDSTMDVINFGRGDIPSSWYARCNIREPNSMSSSSILLNETKSLRSLSNGVASSNNRELRNRNLEIVESVQFPDISALQLECNVEGVGTLDPIGGYTVSPANFTLSIINNALCVSVMRYHENGASSTTDVFLSCVSGYQRVCGRTSPGGACRRAFINCQAEWESGNQFLEVNWRSGDTTVEVLSTFGRGSVLGSWASRCNTRGLYDSESPLQISDSNDTAIEDLPDSYSCPNVFPLELDCEIAAAGGTSVETMSITTILPQNAECISALLFENLVTGRIIYLSCVSGYHRACNKRSTSNMGCERAFIKCQGEGGDQFIEGNWIVGAPTMDVVNMYRYGDVTGSWASTCNIIESPTQAPSQAPSNEPSRAPSSKPTQPITNVPVNAPTVKFSSRPTVAPSNILPKVNPFQSDLPTVSPSQSPTQSPSPISSELETKIPSPTPTTGPMQTPSVLPSSAPSTESTVEPSFGSTNDPSESPSSVPTVTPSGLPSALPSVAPTMSPTSLPSEEPSPVPSSISSQGQDGGDTSWGAGDTSWGSGDTSWGSSSGSPSSAPTGTPSSLPSAVPSSAPTTSPTSIPSEVPSEVPSQNSGDTSWGGGDTSWSSGDTSWGGNLPTPGPTTIPSNSPTIAPSQKPTRSPTHHPTPQPSLEPSLDPTEAPTSRPSSLPTVNPTYTPTQAPSQKPSFYPTNQPTYMPIQSPTQGPTWEPTYQPIQPTKLPIHKLTSAPTMKSDGIPSTNLPIPFRPSPAPTMDSGGIPSSPNQENGDTSWGGGDTSWGGGDTSWGSGDTN